MLWLIAAMLPAGGGCTRLPFLPHLEIDRFAESNDAIETMEVMGVLYTRVVNPKAAADAGAPPAIWIPAQVFQAGSYTAYTADLPKAREISIVGKSPTPDNHAATAVTANPLLTSLAGTEETLAEKPSAPPLTLRRRVLLFPSQCSLQHPDMATFLSLELEDKLPLRVIDCQDQLLREKNRLLNQDSEIKEAVRGWLKASTKLPTVQFIIFLSTTPGRNYQYYTCNFIDAQTGVESASFTFRQNLKGAWLLPLVPNDPTPLRRLIESTTWWTSVGNGQEPDSYLLAAGHRSDLLYGKTLQVFRASEPVTDPKNRNILGYAFTEPLGEISVVDFFGDDSSIAKSRAPLSGRFNQAYAVEISENTAEKMPEINPDQQ